MRPELAEFGLRDTEAHAGMKAELQWLVSGVYADIVGCASHQTLLSKQSRKGATVKACRLCVEAGEGDLFPCFDPDFKSSEGGLSGTVDRWIARAVQPYRIGAGIERLDAASICGAHQFISWRSDVSPVLQKWGERSQQTVLRLLAMELGIKFLIWR
ncbi:hypothetical protein N657DRAFT_39377 [Parathielavia appendiculata]|uniref:Uncharacterized protein n=1 Tax=Parathielavia appendiculata TaxID=2587402 RepID=A0AAN6UA70_9PEZI|nr:hypothetical protein N657DRAFT_39377 [Parathielavia appendiculata]